MPAQVGRVLCACVVVVAGACSSGAHSSSRSPAGTSALPATLSPQHAVGVTTRTFVDASRTTPEHLSVPGKPTRTLQTTIWYPAQGKADATPVAGAAPDTTRGPYPLVVFAHGFGGNPQFYATVLTRWAAAGFVVAAPLFPLTHSGTPGGPDQDDQVNQPADVRFTITSMLALNAKGGAFHGLVSPSEIGVSGQSDGAVTVLAFLNSCCTDPRVRAVEAISGDPEAYPDGSYRTRDNPPTLIAHGTLDPLLPFNQMVSFYNQLTGPKAFLSMVGADHTDYLVPGKWFDSFVLTTIDFWRTYLEQSHAAASRLPHDARSGSTVVYTAPTSNASSRVPLLPEAKTNRHASLSASTDLTNGQTITVTWSGYLPGKVVNVVQCSSSAESGCDIAAGHVLVPDKSGRGSIPLTLVVGKVGDGVCDTAHSCQVVVNDAGLVDPSATVRIPITFKSGSS